MLDKIKLSSDSSKILDMLAMNMMIKKGAVCRIALTFSLNTEENVTFDDDLLGYEFTRDEILGSDEFILYSMISQKYLSAIDYKKSFGTLIRYNIIRGLHLLEVEYNRLNSPTEFSLMLCGNPTLLGGDSMNNLERKNEEVVLIKDRKKHGNKRK